MKKLSLILIALFSMSIGFAQEDVEYVSEEVILFDGIYRSFADFQNNTPLTFDSVSTGDNFPAIMRKMSKGEVFMTDGKGNHLALLDSVFGMCYKGKPYFYAYGKFTPFIEYGSMCLVNVTEVYEIDQPRIQPRGGIGVSNYGTSVGFGVQINAGKQTASSIVTYGINIVTGDMFQMTTKTVEVLLQKNKELYDEYRALPQKKKEKRMAEFIHRYNLIYPYNFNN